MDFVALIVAIHDQFDRADIPHAFGGALALGYVAEPRGTVDIDVNVFLTPDDMNRVTNALAVLGFRPSTPDGDAPPIAGVRFDHPEHPFPVDVFPSLHDRYSHIEQRRKFHPFGRGRDLLPFLSAEDLCVFKLSFSRPKDWVDLQAVVSARPALDIDYIEGQAVALRGPTMYPRVARLRSFLRKP